MAARSNIAIADATSPSPVTRTFVPSKVVDDVGVSEAHFENRSGGISVGYDLLHMKMRRPDTRSRVYRKEVRLILPKLEVVNASTYSGITPAPTRAYTNEASIGYFTHERASAQEKLDLTELVANLANHATIRAMAGTDDFPW